MKKIYLFYLYDEKDKMTDDIYPGINGLDIIKGNQFYHVLYAWTPNKELRKLFKNLRDMTKFREVIHEITNDEFNKFADENSDTFLEERIITTKHLDNKKVICKQNVYILSTKKEIDIIVYDYHRILQKELECLVLSGIYLREMYFSEIYQNILNFFNFDDIMTSVYPLDESDSLPFDIFNSDNLAVYSHLYHNTYRKDICNL